MHRNLLFIICISLAGCLSVKDLPKGHKLVRHHRNGDGTTTVVIRREDGSEYEMTGKTHSQLYEILYGQ